VRSPKASEASGCIHPGWFDLPEYFSLQSSQTILSRTQSNPFRSAGINDLKAIALFPKQRNAIVANCQANIKQIVDESRSLGAVAIVTTIFPVGEVPLERQAFWSDAIGQAVKEINAYIATLATEKTIVFDTVPILADSQGLMLRKYRENELHLNQQGYGSLNQKLAQLLPAIESEKIHP
jgi:lysophospholipase L1-like esterase